ncbi:MAG: T9SS type A sorting domain-containing protein, partial [Bacteroidia bacterium]|nr:T9SS type A sorting domain-containing protein [Bacteroidia bacterium]
RCGEWDGADSPEDGTPFAGWTISNATIIGRRPGANDRLITYRANGRGQLWNSIGIAQNSGVDIEVVARSKVSTDSYAGFKAGELALANNIFWDVADNTAEGIFKVTLEAGGWASLADSTAISDTANTNFQASFAANGNIAKDPKIAGLSWNNDGGLDPRFSDYEVNANIGTINDPFFTPTTYKGAFAPDANSFWAKGWTAMDHYGYFGSLDTNVVASNEEIIEPAAIVKYFPNPTNGILNIVAEDLNQSTVTIRVFDLNGRMVANELTLPVAGELNTQIDLSAQQKGMYIVTVENNGRTNAARIVLK